jgi:hypothetical protein
MNKQHTPGPWEIGRVSAPNTGATPIRWKGENIAWACGKDSAHRLDEATARANAQLVAAAPELLDALQELVDQLEGVGIAIEEEDSGQWHGAEGLSFAKARAAIAKAEGGQQ